MCSTTTPNRPYSNGRPALFQNKDDDFKNKRIRTKKCPNSNKNNNKKSVRFDLKEVTVQPIEPSLSRYSSTLTWLSPNEYAIIQNGVVKTLDLMELQAYSSFESMPSASSSRYCTRGLENFSTTRKGCLKPNVAIRRQNAIRSVMTEQELQRSAAAANDGKHFYNDVKMRETYKTNVTRLNAMKALETGLFDSEIALSMYSEQQLQQQQQHQQQCHAVLTDSSTNLFQKAEKTWSFTTIQSQQNIVTATMA